MRNSISLQKNTGANLCPHGLIQSACPICSKSNFASSAGNSSSKQWSYQKCYVEGLHIKAAFHRQETARNFFETRFQNSLIASKNIQNLIVRFNQYIQNIKLPVIKSTLQFLTNTAANFLFSKTTKNFQQKAVNIIFHASDKLVNILGEIKNFNDRKIFNDLKKQAKKFMSFCLSVIEDENYKNDEILAVFKSRELKRYIKYEHRNNTK